MKPNEDMHEICSCDNGQSFYECSILRMKYSTYTGLTGGEQDDFFYEQ